MCPVHQGSMYVRRETLRMLVMITLPRVSGCCIHCLHFSSSGLREAELPPLPAPCQTTPCPSNVFAQAPAHLSSLPSPQHPRSLHPLPGWLQTSSRLQGEEPVSSPPGTLTPFC